MFNSQGHNAMCSLQVEEPVHTSWSKFCTVSHQALASKYQRSNVRVELATSEVEGEHSKHYITEPLLIACRNYTTWSRCFIETVLHWQTSSNFPHPGGGKDFNLLSHQRKCFDYCALSVIYLSTLNNHLSNRHADYKTLVLYWRS